MDVKKHPRHIKLIKPGLQIKLTLTFAGLSALSLLLEYLLLQSSLTQLSTSMPVGGDYLIDALPKTLGTSLAVSFLLLLPLTFAIGVLITFRIAGPVYNFEQYLNRIARGEETGPCRIRKGDELKELCRAINAATKPLRNEKEESAGDGESVEKARSRLSDVA